MYRALRPLLFRLDPETAHDLTLRLAAALQRAALPRVAARFAYADARLGQTLFGLRFPNPVGLAAGMDKNGRLVRFWGALGFGFVEVGSVTARASGGNPRPRLFRLPADGALVNRMGLGNQGAARVAGRLRVLRAAGGPRPVLAVNVAKTHDPAVLGPDAVEDFRAGFRAAAPVADLVVLNVSCPNTREGKTFEEPAALEALLQAVTVERDALGLRVPVLVKLAPPAADGPLDGRYDELASVAEAYGVAGYVATNTAPDRAGLATPAARLAAVGPGGLSGRPLAERARRLVAWLHRRTGGALPVVGVGGVDSAEAAYRLVRAGASLVEVYTGFVYEGPGLPRAIHRGLVAALDRDGLGSIADAVGLDA